MQNNNLLIKNARVVDPGADRDEIADILIEKGKVSKVAGEIRTDTARVIPAAGKIAMPGLVDMHVHLREPGREDKETVSSGTRAALRGGVTSILAMPNTSPAIDNAESVKELKEIIKKGAHANVFISAAITVGRKGAELTDFGGLKKAGVLALTDDGSSVDNEELMLQAFERAKGQALLVICHCEDKSLSARGVVNLGLTSTRLGLRGISKESEYMRVARDIKLADKAQAAVHIAHVSCKESVELIGQAKKKGIKVTCETAPHYFSLSEEAVLGYDTNKKINPPLRGKEDVIAIKEALGNGIIDVIASDHAPHADNEKAIEFERAEFGTTGLETELAAAITELVDTGLLNWPAIARRMCLSPAHILGIDKGVLNIGKDADIVIVDPAREWVVEEKDFLSKSKNSAFLGRRLRGSVEYTIRAGKVVYSRGD